MAKENLIGVKAKNSLNHSILKQSGCATGNNTTLFTVNWWSAILASKTTGAV